MQRRRGRPHGYRPNGAEIYRLRVRVHGFKRAELAAKVGFSYDSIKSAELGNNISELLAARLAKAPGVRMSDISDWPEDDDTGERRGDEGPRLDAKTPGRGNAGPTS
jgi:hypothetical protein